MKQVAFPLRIFLVGVVFRFLPIIAMHSIGIGLDDMYQYDMLARSIVNGNGYRWYSLIDITPLDPYVKFHLSDQEYDPIRGVETSFRAPLYPFFLACIYFFSGTGPHRFLAARLAQALMGGLLAPLTYYLAKGFFLSSPSENTRKAERTAVVSSWIVACYPMLGLYPFGLATENLFFLFLLISFFWLQKIEGCREWKIAYASLCGLFLAMAVLTRSVILPFALLAILWCWFSLKERKCALVIALVFIAIIFPWIFRNSLIHEKLTGIETSMGYNLYMGYHPDSNGSFTYGISLDLLPILNDAERDHIGTQKAISFIQANPHHALKLMLNRLSFFFGLEKRVLFYFYSNNFLGHIPAIPLFVILLLMLLPFIWVAGSAPLGLALSGTRPQIILFYALFFTYLIPHVLILSEDRFHLAMVPFLAIFASHAWSAGWSGFREALTTSGGYKKLFFIFAGITILLLTANWSWEIWRDWDKFAQLLSENGNTLYLPY